MTTPLTLDTIRHAPKALLHDHLDGGLRPQTIIDIADMMMPYASHKITPSRKTQYIPNEMSAADRVRQTCMTCGRKAAVVHVPATNPSISTSCMLAPFA